MASDRLTIAAARPGMLPDNLAEIIEEEMREWRGANGGVFAIPACALGISIAIRAAMTATPAPAPQQPFHLTPQQFQEMHNAG